MTKRIGGIAVALAVLLMTAAGNILPAGAYDESDRHKYPTDAYLQGIKCSDGGNRSKYIDNTSDFFKQNKLNMMWTWYDTAKDTVERMQLTKVFITHTHGNTNFFNVTDSNGKETSVTTDMIKALPKNKLSDLQLCFYGTCLAGEGEKNAANLVNVTADKGARVVIGFIGDTGVPQMNQYLTDFLKSAIQKRNNYKQAMADGLYWAKFWNFGLARGTDKPYTRGDLTKRFPTANYK